MTRAVPAPPAVVVTPSPLLVYTQPPTPSSTNHCPCGYSTGRGLSDCHVCYGKSLTSCGIYKNVRQVLAMDSFYSTACEYLECGKCHKKYIGWSDVVLQQLNVGHRSYFPAILTYKYVASLTLLI